MVLPSSSAQRLRRSHDGRGARVAPTSTRSVPGLSGRPARTVVIMGSPYHQFCPVAKAMELLDERWTLLVIRELLAGSRHFNDLRRGLPRMSPTLLSKRLNQLVASGVVERRRDGREVVYAPTRAGEELRPAIELLGAWGMRWTGVLGDVDLDPKLLMWDLHRNVDRALVPPGTTVVRFDFTDVDRSAGAVVDRADSRGGRRLRRRPRARGGRHGRRIRCAVWWRSGAATGPGSTPSGPSP